MQIDMFENCGSIDACGRLQVLALLQQVISSTKVYTSRVIGDTFHRTYCGGWEKDAENCSWIFECWRRKSSGNGERGSHSFKAKLLRNYVRMSEICRAVQQIMYRIH